MNDLDWFQEAKSLSAYHFDNDRIDPRFDAAIGLGRFSGDWSDEVEEIVSRALPVSMAVRGNVKQTKYHEESYNGPDADHGQFKNGKYEFEKQFFDKTDVDYDKYQIITKTAEWGPKVQKMIDCFAFANPQWHTVHVQRTGQVFPYHIDVFHRRNTIADLDPSKVLRVMVMLNDWQPGMWFGYGNYTYTHWKAGDFHTFSHKDTPHYTANASFTPRVSALLTGVVTPETEAFLYKARTTVSIAID
jgi:hypothetical protein